MRRSSVTSSDDCQENTQKTSGIDAFEIRSFIRTLTQNHPRLNGQTFRDEPGPGKSLSEIVNRISNSIPTQQKSISDETPNFLKHQRTKNFDHERKNLRTDSGSHRISMSSSRRNEKVDYMTFPNAIWNSNNSPELVEIFSDAKEKRELDQWGSSRSLVSRNNHGFDNISIRSSTSKNRIPSTVNFEEELWPTSPSFVISSSNFTREISNIYPNHREIQEAAERLEEIPTRDVSRKMETEIPVENILLEKSNELIIPTEILKVGGINDIMSNKSQTKFSSKNRSRHRMKGKRSLRMISPSKFPSHLRIIKARSITNNTKIETMKAANYEILEIKSCENNEPVEMPNEEKYGDVVSTQKSEDNKCQLQAKKNTKYDQVKSRYACGISGSLPIVAKESKMMIPQSARLRSLFRPLAGFQESLGMKTRLKKKSIDDKTNKGVLQHPVWRPGGSNAPSHRQNSEKRSPISSPDKEHHNIPVSRSKTLIPQVKSEIQSSKINEETLEIVQNLGIPDSSETLKEETTKKFGRHSKSLKILKDILSLPEEKTRRKKTSSEFTDENSKTLLEKLASLSEASDSGASITPKMSKSIEDEKVPEIMEGIFKIDAESQTPMKNEESQGFQTELSFTNNQENYKATGTQIDSIVMPKNFVDAQSSCNDFLSISAKDINKAVFFQMDAFSNQISQTSSINFFQQKESQTTDNYTNKGRLVQTQTSKTSFQSFQEEKRDVSMETIKMRVRSKQINTDKKILIDTASGICSMGDSQFQKIDNSSQVDNVRDIEEEKNTIQFPIKYSSCEKIFSSFSNDLNSSKKCLIECCQNFSTKIIEKQEELSKIPMDVIKGFEIAAERVQNIHKAIEIYHQNLGKQIEIENFNAKLENTSKSLKSVEGIQQNMGNFILQQKHSTDVENSSDEMKTKNEASTREIDENSLIKSITFDEDIHHGFRYFPVSRETFLPIIYVAVCLFVFWSLQYSMTCNLS